MFYLEIRDNKGNWSNEIGDYNHFETLQEAIDAIPELIMVDIGVNSDWRVLDEKGIQVFFKHGNNVG